MRSFNIIAGWISATLVFVPLAYAVTLQSVYDAAGPGEEIYHKLLILDPAETYMGGIMMERGTRCCIHGNGAVIDLDWESLYAVGYGSVLDVDHCVLVGGYAGCYISEGATGTIRNNTIYACGYGVTSWYGDETLLIENNIIVGSLNYGIYCRQYLEPFIHYNTVWDSQGGNYMENCG